MMSLNESLVNIENQEKPNLARYNPNTYLINKTKQIINHLTQVLKENRSQQANLNKKYFDLFERQKKIETTIEKITKLSKNKQKKHYKYLNYIPLSKIYFYCPKKNPFYYMLLDIIISCRKKNKQKYLTTTNNQQNIESLCNRNNNRFHFSKSDDNLLKSLLNHEVENDIDWEGVANHMKKVPLEIFVRNLELSNFYDYKKWTLQEDTILKKSIIYYGPKNWQQISYCLDGRNNSQCFHRWMKGINPKIMRTKWSFEEDLILGLALKIYGNKKWSKIANHLTGRTDIQCRERYCNILDPSLEEVEWKESEDIKLITLYEKYGGKWSKIARDFGNRTDNTCWRRWKHLIGLTNSLGENGESTEVNNFIVNYDRKKSILEKNLFRHDIIDDEEDFDNLSIDSDENEKSLKTLKSSVSLNNKSSVDTYNFIELKKKNKLNKVKVVKEEIKKKDIIFVSKKMKKKNHIEDLEVKERIFNIVK